VSALLDQIRPLLAAAEARVQTLREIERLALALDGVGEGTAPAPKPAAARTVAEDGGVLPRSGEGASDAGAAVAQEAGIPVPAATVQTPPEFGPPAPGSGPSGNGRAPRTPTQAQARILAVLDEAPSTVNDIAARLDITKSAVDQVMRRLRRDDLAVTITPAAGRRPALWGTRSSLDRATATRQQGRVTGTSKPLAHLNVEIEALLRNARGGGSETDIAEALGLDREDVAVACGDLLEAGRVSLRPDGTYVQTEVHDDARP
jgi:predicted transcriptional regulator